MMNSARILLLIVVISCLPISSVYLNIGEFKVMPEEGNHPLSMIWAGSSSDEGRAIVVDQNGNSYITGRTYSAREGGSDMLLVKWDETGNQLWNRTWTFFDSHSSGSDLVLDTNEKYIYVVGDVSNYDINGTGELLLIKGDVEGNLLWNRTWGGKFGSWTTGRGIALDSAEHIYTVGYIPHSEFIEGEYPYYRSLYSFILVKWTDNGTQLWNRTLEFSGFIYGHGITIVEDIIYTVGSINASHLLIAWNPEGEQLWNRTWQAPEASNHGQTTFYSVVVDAIGRIYTTGTYVTGSGYQMRAFSVLVSWDAEGNQLWNYTRAEVLSNDLIVTSSHTVYTLGSFTGSILILPQVYLETIKWSTEGELIGHQTWSSISQGYGITSDKQGNLYCVGTYTLYPSSNTDVIIVVFSRNNFRPISVLPIDSVILLLAAIPLSLVLGVVLLKLYRKKKGKPA